MRVVTRCSCRHCSCALAAARGQRAIHARRACAAADSRAGVCRLPRSMTAPRADAPRRRRAGHVTPRVLIRAARPARHRRRDADRRPDRPAVTSSAAPVTLRSAARRHRATQHRHRRVAQHRRRSTKRWRSRQIDHACEGDRCRATTSSRSSRRPCRWRAARTGRATGDARFRARLARVMVGNENSAVSATGDFMMVERGSDARRRQPGARFAVYRDVRQRRRAASRHRRSGGRDVE